MPSGQTQTEILSFGATQVDQHQPVLSQQRLGRRPDLTTPTPLDLQTAPAVEMTWVIGEHVATPGSQELTVHKGQQVEVLEVTTSTPDMCLVRMRTSGSSVDTPPEGLVPLAVLKQPPKTSPSRRAPGVAATISVDHDSGESSRSLCTTHSHYSQFVVCSDAPI